MALRSVVAATAAVLRRPSLARAPISAVARTTVRACSTSATDMFQAPHLQRAYTAARLAVDAHARAATMAGSHASAAHAYAAAAPQHASRGADVTDAQALLMNFVLAVGIGLGVYVGTHGWSPRTTVPADALAALSQGESLMAQNAPVSAAAAFERASSSLMAAGGSSLPLIFALTRSADAHAAAGRQRDALTALQRARQLCEEALAAHPVPPVEELRPRRLTLSRLRREQEAAETAAHTLSAADVPHMLIAVLDRSAELHGSAGEVAAAHACFQAASRLAEQHYPAILRTAVDFMHACTRAHAEGSRYMEPVTDGAAQAVGSAALSRDLSASCAGLDAPARRVAADIAGMYYNASTHARKHAVATQPSGAEALDSCCADSAVSSTRLAERALALISAARAGAMHEAASIIQGSTAADVRYEAAVDAHVRSSIAATAASVCSSHDDCLPETAWPPHVLALAKARMQLLPLSCVRGIVDLDGHAGDDIAAVTTTLWSELHTLTSLHAMAERAYGQAALLEQGHQQQAC